MENASSRKSKSENFISKFARIYTPAVCISALALAVLPPLVRLLAMGISPEWGMWIYRALTFLVISCPCALVISIPLSFFAGIGGASREGILVKGSNYLETLSKTGVVVFDKTGTLTQGVFEVNGIHHSEMEDHKILEYAALAESSSSHPISRSLQRAYGKEIDRSRVTDCLLYTSMRFLRRKIADMILKVRISPELSQPMRHRPFLIQIHITGRFPNPSRLRNWQNRVTVPTLPM